MASARRVLFSHSLLLKVLKPKWPLIKIQTTIWGSWQLNGPRGPEERMSLHVLTEEQEGGGRERGQEENIKEVCDGEVI